MLLQRGLDNLIATTEAESKVNKAAMSARVSLVSLFQLAEIVKNHRLLLFPFI